MRESYPIDRWAARVPDQREFWKIGPKVYWWNEEHLQWIDLDALALEAKYNVNAFAKLLGVNVRTLQRKFRNQLELTPKNWLRERRLIEAQALLKADWRIASIIDKLGFQTRSHFSSEFKSLCGYSPSEARDRARGREGDDDVSPAGADSESGLAPKSHAGTQS